jgi:ribosomal protein S18 acetylase RimI-like enzyme
MGMADGAMIRALQASDLRAYKHLRDTVLAAEPSAFTSDSAEERRKPAESYRARFGLDRADAGQFTLGAFDAADGGAGALIGAVTCERDPRIKGRHIGHIAGMMVLAHARGRGVGRGLLDACIATARRAAGLELLTLSVTSSNHIAVGLYEHAGFTRYGTLVRAIKIGAHYHDKDLMVLML